MRQSISRSIPKKKFNLMKIEIQPTTQTYFFEKQRKITRNVSESIK